MITDTQARTIAAQWHGGGGTALYAFASTGAIDTARTDHNLTEECWRCIAGQQKVLANGFLSDAEYVHDYEEIKRLIDYVTTHKQRGPVPGWAELS